MEPERIEALSGGEAMVGSSVWRGDEKGGVSDLRCNTDKTSSLIDRHLGKGGTGKDAGGLRRARTARESQTATRREMRTASGDGTHDVGTDETQATGARALTGWCLPR